MAPDESRSWKIAHIDDIPWEEGEGPTTEWKPIRRYFGIGSFGANASRATEAGAVLTHDHTEVAEAGTRHEELFLIVSGHAVYRVEGEEIDAPAGTFLYVGDPETMRGVVAKEPGTWMLALGAEPGKVFTPSDWDLAPIGA
jgi:mannose-6-phosphate isomerase-like protein (cupin superfamily)